MASITTLTPKAALFIANWLEEGVHNESSSPDECADPALDIADTLNPFGTADADCAMIICSPEDAEAIHALASNDLPDDPIDILAVACARAYQVMGATNAYDGIRNTTRSESFHNTANILIGAMQLELGRLAGLCNGDGFQNSSIAEALYNGSASPKQCLDAAKIAKSLPIIPVDDATDLHLKRGELTDLIEAVSGMDHQDPKTRDELLAKLERAAGSIDERHNSANGDAS